MRYYLQHVWKKLSSQSRGLDENARTEFYNKIWRDAAFQLGAEFKRLPHGFCEIKYGEHLTRMYENVLMIDHPLSLKLATSKAVAYKLMSEGKIPIPEHCEFTVSEIEKAWSFMQSLNCACVVKPAQGTGGGMGVTTGVNTMRDLKRAALYASLFSHKLLIERQLLGDSYRLLYLDGELIDALRRKSPKVIGDGHATIRELIEKENHRRTQMDGFSALTLISIDLECRSTLRRAGLSLNSVPNVGAEVPVKTVSNDNSAQENESVRDNISADLVKSGARAASIMGIRFAGVDVITEDPTVDLKQSGGVIIEVNATPGLHFHYQTGNTENSVRVAVPVLRVLLGLNNRK